MSLQNNKAALFGKKKTDGQSGQSNNVPSATRQIQSTSVNSPASITANSKNETQSKTAGMSISKPSNSGLSNEAKLKKITDAREQSEKGMEALKTSLFQWSPDYLSAGNYFEKSSDLYKLANDLENAIRMILKAAECHEHVGATAAVALAKVKAANYELELGFPKKAIKTFLEAAEAWGIHGDLQRFADTMGKAASHAESVDVNKAREYYFKALDTLCPPNTPKEQLSSTHPSVIELFRNITAFLVKHKLYQDAIVIYQRFIAMADAFALEAALTKSYLAITTLYLAMNDPVKAQQVYLNEHLNNQTYMRSKDCELADLLILAFVNHDMDMLDKAKVHTSISFQDREIQQLIRGFSDYDVAGDGDGGNEPPPKVEVPKSSLFGKPKSSILPVANDSTVESGTSDNNSEHHKHNHHHEHVSFAATDDEVTDIPSTTAPTLSEELDSFKLEYADNNYDHDNTSKQDDDDEIDLS